MTLYPDQFRKRPLRGQAGLCLVLFFSLCGPLWAPVNPGWCKSQAVITTTANLAFGSFATTDVGLVNISPSGIRTYSGGLIMMGGTVSAGVFNVTGCANYTYSIVLPPDTTLSSATSSMLVTTFQSNPTGSGVLDGAGAATLTLGAVLNVGLAQPSGAYTGTFTMEVVFN